MGVYTSLAPLYGYFRKGERVHLEVPRNLKARAPLSWPRSPLAGRASRWPSRAPTDQEVFDSYIIEHALAPASEAGQVVIMDNLPAHNGRPV